MTNTRNFYFQQLDELNLKVEDNHFVFLLIEKQADASLFSKIMQFMDIVNHIIVHSPSLPSKFKCVLILENDDASFEDLIALTNENNRWENHLLILKKPDAEMIDAVYARTDVFFDWNSTALDNPFTLKAIQLRLPIFCTDATLQAQLWATSVPDFKNSIVLQIAFWLQVLQNSTVLRSIKRSQYRALLNTTIPSSSIEQKLTRLNWQIEGPYDSSYSLALVNRELALALHRIGKEVSLRCYDGMKDVIPNDLYLEAYPELKLLMKAVHYDTNSNNDAQITLRNTYPPYLTDMQGELKILSSYGWEETSYPLEFVEHINFKADAVFVVSRFVKKSLQESGVRVPLFVVGNGVDHLLHIKTIKRHDTTNWKKFRFLHISSCFPRKGVDLLLKAYSEEFSIEDDVSLIIKTFANPHNDLLAQLDNLRSSNPAFPHVEIIWDDYSDAQIKALYIDCDAVVIPSRGEGFGLPVAEAILMEKPVITTHWSGQNDFINEDNAWCVDFDFEDTQSHFSGMHSAWASPKVIMIKQFMREIFLTDKAALQTKIQRAKTALLSNFKWEDVAKRNLAAVTLLNNTLQTHSHSASKITWVSSWNTRCGIASYSEFLTQKIPHSSLTILASHTIERTKKDEKNVVRCWGNDFLDSIDDLKFQIEQQHTDILVIQYNFGFFSLQKLAELILLNKLKGRQVHVFFHATGDLYINDNLVSLKSIVKTLEKADKIFVHAIRDLNHLKSIGLIDNVVYFPQGILEANDINSEIEPHFSVNNLQANEKIIATYGFLMPHKGVSNMIHAFKKWLDKGNVGRLLLVNSVYPSEQSASELKNCESIIRRLGIDHLVSLHSDYLADVESLKLLKYADLIVYAYQDTNESSSAAVRLGLASGQPVAVTPLHIFKDVADVTYEFPGTSEDDLVLGLELFFNDESNIKNKIAMNLKKWKKERIWPSLSQRLINIFESIKTDIAINK